MPWTGAPATWIAGSTLLASQLNLELRDRMVVLRAGGFALSGQVTDDLMTAVSATQWARIPRASVLSGSVMRAFQYTAVFTGTDPDPNAPEIVNVDITSAGLTDINDGVIILHTMNASGDVAFTWELTSAINARVSSSIRPNAINFLFSVLKLSP